jgi:hypothetical protein
MKYNIALECDVNGFKNAIAKNVQRNINVIGDITLNKSYVDLIFDGTNGELSFTRPLVISSIKRFLYDYNLKFSISGTSSRVVISGRILFKKVVVFGLIALTPLFIFLDIAFKDNHFFISLFFISLFFILLTAHFYFEFIRFKKEVTKIFETLCDSISPEPHSL